jgi:hypothetical protein
MNDRDQRAMTKALRILHNIDFESPHYGRLDGYDFEKAERVAEELYTPAHAARVKIAIQHLENLYFADDLSTDTPDGGGDVRSTYTPERG